MQLLQFEDIHTGGDYIAVATSGDLFRASYSEKHKNMFFAIPSTYRIAGYRPAGNPGGWASTGTQSAAHTPAAARCSPRFTPSPSP